MELPGPLKVHLVPPGLGGLWVAGTPPGIHCHSKLLARIPSFAIIRDRVVPRATEHANRRALFHPPEEPYLFESPPFSPRGRRVFLSFGLDGPTVRSARPPPFWRVSSFLRSMRGRRLDQFHHRGPGVQPVPAGRGSKWQDRPRTIRSGPPRRRGRGPVGLEAN